MQDAYVNGFLKDLMKIGTFSKQILNYSYPPLLYQRGEDSEDDEDEDDEEEETEGESSAQSDDDLSHNQFGDDFNMDNLLG